MFADLLPGDDDSCLKGIKMLGAVALVLFILEIVLVYFSIANDLRIAHRIVFITFFLESALSASIVLQLFFLIIRKQLMAKALVPLLIFTTAMILFMYVHYHSFVNLARYGV